MCLYVFRCGCNGVGKCFVVSCLKAPSGCNCDKCKVLVSWFVSSEVSSVNARVGQTVMMVELSFLKNELDLFLF